MDVTALSLSELARAYRTGELRPTEVTEAYLRRLEPGPVYRLVTAERALTQAQRAEALFRRGVDLGPLQGVPLALKDLMDTRGDVTAAGSRVLSQRPPAPQDCPAAARLDASGAVFLGKTTMTELAFSGLGLNPHFGTPANAFDPARVPGGSSSGSAVAVATGLACAAIGSDTGGSVRIPAAFNNLVGLKTTDGSVPTEGCVALSTTLDTLGPMTRTVEDAWHVWRALAGKPPAPFSPQPVRGLKLLLPTTVLQEGLDAAVHAAFEGACEALRAAGATLEVRAVPVLAELNGLYGRFGSFAAMEALALYEDLLQEAEGMFDPRVAARILSSRGRSATDYIRLSYERTRLQRAFWVACEGFDALLAPTVAVLPPKLDELGEDEAYFAANALVLRNTTLFNLLGTPAVSVPCGKMVGLMIAARPHAEELVLALARALEVA
jgi:aspartyl-tRNA(Asn)/glutamyl-tRNA(Gln) amidotransferase subunit A